MTHRWMSGVLHGATSAAVVLAGGLLLSDSRPKPPALEPGAFEGESVTR
ncbi:hypothetical protein [Nonomuraea sp. PA05]|nr:hypothetical protein [Nonomuraea sp. PA05]